MGSEGDLTPKQQHEQTLEQRNIMSTRASLERFLFKVQKRLRVLMETKGSEIWIIISGPNQRHHPKFSIS